MYTHKDLEKKWQTYWEKHKTFKTPNDFSKPKYYCLDMFPFPSWAWLHVGHPEWMTANDIVARYKHTNWYNVLHPMWWDAFWLPAENYAIKTWAHPKITTKDNIDNFRKQIKSLWFSYDWDREVDTTDPKYYKWTQWIFLKLFEKGLAYEQDLPINYCPHCKTWVANEEVLNDFTHERCGNRVEKKQIRQWVLAITKYADRLINDVDRLDWPEWIKDMQRNWIWKSEGCEFELKKDLDNSKSIRVYTTRIDTVFWITYAVLAPDHKSVNDFITSEQKDTCLSYIEQVNKKSDQDRIQDDKEKTWVFTGSYVINPFNWKEVPLWIADYVLWNYGTWAVMAVPGHDIRDFEFAKKYDLEINYVITKNDILNFEECFTDYWILMNSLEFNWLTSEEAKIKLTEFTEQKWFGHKKVNYKLRDWLFSRQRYWWEPIPLIHLKKEDLDKLERIDNKKSENSYSETEGVTHNGNTAKFSLSEFSIIESVKKVKKKDDKKTFYKINQVIKSKKWLIIFDWQKLIKHFSVKTRKEINFRISFWETIIKYLDEIVYESDIIWYIAIRNYIFRIILQKIENWNYEIKTYYSTLKLTKLFNKAYIKKEQDWEYLYSKWQEISKIYDWIYTKIVCDYNLPLKLPEVEKYEPAWNWQSPLANIEDFVNVVLADNLTWKRETNTMPQWGWSCWYYLRYMDPDNKEELVNKDIANYWWEVDSYVGWAEHAVLHLLYARFWHKFLYDIWIVPTDEPFFRLRNQGLILAYSYQNSNGKLIANDLVQEKDWNYFDLEIWEKLKKVVAKMSKSLKNVVNPDEIVDEYWADSLRLYEMYMAEFKDSAPWDSKNIIWVRRFIEKSERLFTTEAKFSSEDDNTIMKLLHKTIKKVEEDINNYKFNTAISSLMILVNNGLPKDTKLQQEWKNIFIRLIHPFIPHLAEELWERIWEKESVFFSKWPIYDLQMTIDNTIKIAVQVLGKVRWEIEISIFEEKESVLEKAKNNADIAKWLEWKEIVKEIYVPGKILNIVIK